MPVNAFGNRLQIRTDVNGGAWHGLGEFVGEKKAVQAMEEFEDGVPHFEKKAISIYNEDDGYSQTGDYAIVREATIDSPTPKVVGYCTNGYHIVQPLDIAKAFDENVNKPIETLGFLSNGEKMFTTWEMPKSSFVVGKGNDEVKLFGTIHAGFDAKVAISLSLITFRTVCQNTFNLAQNIIRNKESEDGGEGRLWVGRHNSPNILRDLSIWMKHVEKEAERKVVLVESLFNKLQDTPIDSKNVLESLINRIYPMPKNLPESYPDELRGQKENKIQIAIEKANFDRSLADRLFNGDGISIDATAWGIFNVCTEIENHHRLSKKDTANSILFGNRSKTMNDALQILATYSDTK